MPPAEPPWMSVARAECGVRASPPAQCNPRITAYHEGIGIQGYDDRGYCRDQSWLAPPVQACCRTSAPSPAELPLTSAHLPLWRAFSR